MDATKRFSNRVEDYRKHRPGYPADIVTILKKEGALPSHAVVADIGSGTGLLTQIFFDHVHRIYGVEPNDDMRRQADMDFSGVSQFTSIAGSAESTTLPPTCIDLVTVAQAFHWFDPEKTRMEFKRILQPDGFVTLVWNYRDFEADDLQREYEAILQKHIPDYKKLNHKTMTDDKIDDFYQNSSVLKLTLPNSQSFDLHALKGRVLSSSYVPKPPDPITERILAQVERLFEKYQQNGQIQFIYNVALYLGRLYERL